MLESAPAFAAANRLGLRVAVMADRPVVAPTGLDVDIYRCDTYKPAEVEAVAKRIARLHKVVGVIGWRERDVEATALAAGVLNLPGHPVSVVRDIQDKGRCRELIAGDPASLVHRSIGPHADLRDSIESFTLPAVVKPAGSSASRGIYRVTTAAELTEAVTAVRTLTQPDRDPVFRRFAGEVVLEEYVEGTEHSVEAVIDEGDVTCAVVTDKWVEPRHHLEFLQIHPSVLTPAVQNQLCEAVRRLVRRLDLKSGTAHVEFRVRDNDEIKLIEVNARPGGNYITSHLIKLATGYDFIEAAILTACAMSIRPFVNEVGAYAGSRELLSSRSGILRAIAGIDQALTQSSVVHLSVETAVGSRVALPPESYTSSLLATVICFGYTATAVHADLAEAIDRMAPIFEENSVCP